MKEIFVNNTKKIIAILSAIVLLIGSIVYLVAHAINEDQAQAANVPVNEGDPFENGDLVWNGQVQTYRLAGVQLSVDSMTDLGAAAPPFAYPACLTEANALFVANKGGGNWPGWGVSDYNYIGLKVIKNSRSLQFTALPNRGHCAQSNNQTTYFGQREGYLNLIPDLSHWNADRSIYHGVFMMAIDNGHKYDVWDQATLGCAYVYADWEANGSISVQKAIAAEDLPTFKEIHGDDWKEKLRTEFQLQREVEKDGEKVWTATSRGTAKSGEGKHIKNDEGALTSRWYTNAEGKLTIEDLKPGRYRLVEYTAPKGCTLPKDDDGKRSATKVCTVKAGDTYVAYYKDANKKKWYNQTTTGKGKVTKVSTNPIPSNDSRYSLLGAEFGIWKNKLCTGEPYKTLKTTSSNTTETVEMLPGNYYLKETKAPKGFDLNTEIVPFEIEADMITEVKLADKPKGWIDLDKNVLTPAAWTKTNSLYTNLAAAYGVYSDAACTKQVDTITTAANGLGRSGLLSEGTYYIQEKAAPENTGYSRDVKKYSIKVTPGAVVPALTPETFVTGNYNISVEKVDYENWNNRKTNDPQGAAKLVGAQYKISYYDGYYSTPAECRSHSVWAGWKSNIITTKLVNGRAIANYEPQALLDDGYGNKVLPVGTYLIEEVKSPEGYHLDPDMIAPNGAVVQVRRQGDSAYSVNVVYGQTKTGSSNLEDSANAVLSRDAVKRADIDIMKFIEETTDPDKYPDHKKPVAGVGFEIINNNDYDVLNVNTRQYVPKGKVIYTLTTNEDGWASTTEIANNCNDRDQSSGRLPYGNYLLKEVAGTQPDGYALIDDYEFSIVANKRGDCTLADSVTHNRCCAADDAANYGTGGDRHFTFNDKVGTAIRVAKKDVETGKFVRGQTTFQLLDENKNVMEFVQDYPAGSVIRTFTTGIDGTCTLPDKLMPGKYYVQEVGAPEGYILNGALVEFTCTGQTAQEHGVYNNPLIVTIADNAAKGKIEITKVDARTKGTIISDEAQYNVYAAADIITQDGSVRATSGRLVDTITTQHGVGVSKELYLGEYRIEEVKAPNGYLVADDSQNVVIEYAGDRIPVVTKAVKQTDEPVYGVIGVEKRDAESSKLVPQAGIAFEIYAAENIVGGDGHIWHAKGDKVDEITTGPDGRGTSTKLLELGRYEAVETQAPHGYSLDKTPVPIELVYADQLTPQVQATGTKTDDVQNFVITMSKLDRETGQVVPIRNTEMEIFAAEDIMKPEGTLVHKSGKLVDYVTTDETGTARTDATDIYEGKYVVKEIHAPEGYVLDSERTYALDLAWNADGRKTVYLTSDISDAPAKGRITFSKVDAENGKVVHVAGCTAEVYANENIVTGDGTIRANKDEKVATLVTDESGTAISDELYLGNYRVVETLAPNGYLINDQPVSVTLQYEDELTPVVSTSNSISDENAKGVIQIIKRDRETGKNVALAGAVFQVCAKNDIVTGDGTVRVPAGQIVATLTTGEDGMCTSEPLYLGTYTVQEITAPVGYTLDANIYDAHIAYKDQNTPITTTSKSIENTAQKGVISVTKTDAETQKPVLAEGATFTVTAKDDIMTGDGTIRAYAGETVDTIITNAEGIAKSKALYLGTYIIKETIAPEGYMLSSEAKEVSLEYGEQTQPIVYEMISLSDQAVKGKVTVEKEDSDLDEPLSNVEYEIRAAEDITGKDGTEWYKKGDVAETIITGEDGTATSKELPLGEYVIVETVQPNGYELDTKEYAVKLRYNDQYTPVVHVDHELVNTPSDLIVQKVDADDEDVKLVGARLMGWEKANEAPPHNLAVFASSECKIVNVTVDYMGEFENIVASDHDNDVNRPVKTITLNSIDTQEVENATDDVEYQTFAYDEKTEQGDYVLHLSYEHNGKQENKDMEFSVNEYDRNVVFALGNDIVSQGDTANSFLEKVADDASSDDGNASGMKDETEEEISAGNSEQEKDANGDEQEKTDSFETESVHISRVPVALTHGKFACSVTDEEGIAKFRYVPQGEIGIAEYMAPDGYATDRTPQYIAFASNGLPADDDSLRDDEGSNNKADVFDLRFQDKKIRLSVSKRDVTTSDELPGNVLSVYESKTYGTAGTEDHIGAEEYGKLIETWVSTNEPHMMALIPKQTYILKEEQAVDGYTIAEDIKFQLNDTGVVQQVVMNNEHKTDLASELVETLGETGVLWPLAATILGVGAVIGYVGYRMLRRRNN